MKHLTKLKKVKKYAFWRELGSQSIQDVAQRMNKGYEKFFEDRKKGIKTNIPKYKKVKKYSSFMLKQAGYKIFPGNEIMIAGQRYKFFKSREIEGKVKTVTVKRDNLGDLYIYFVCETQENQVLPRTGNSVGFDFGLKTFLKGSDELEIDCPEFFKQAQKSIRKASRELSRKKKCSKNQRKANLNLARIHKKIANQRRDFQFKLAMFLADHYAKICIEDLNIKAMKKLWGKKISDLAFSEFISILQYECSRTGSQLIKIDRFYPSSKTCFDCGYKLEELGLETRQWTCPNCGQTHDRDLNAAKNIHREGLKQAA